MVLGKLPPGKKSPGKLPLGKLPLPENFPKEKLPQKIVPIKIFCEFFLVSSFYIYENFRPQGKSIFIQLFFYYKFVYSICLHYFFLSVYFWFPAWHIMFIIHIWVTNNAGHRYLAPRFFISKAFFNSASVLLNILIKWASNVA